MGKTFFVGWALWEKMVFVLACCIVLTMFGGCLKLWYMHHQLRKHTKAGPKPISREKSIIRSLSVRKPKKKQPTQPMVQKRRLMEQDGVSVPFGIRAIESGIEVDGVWISRTNTPATSVRGSSSNSMYQKVPQQSRQGSMVDVSSSILSSKDVPEASPFDTASTVASSSREASQTLTIDRSFSGDSIGERPSSPEPVAQGTRRYPPHSYMRYDGSSARNFRNSHTLEYKTPTGYPTDKSTSNRSSTTSESGSSRNGSSGSNEFPYMEPTTRPPPQVRSISNPDFDALQTHRMSQVAETGHLVPRSRRPGNSPELIGPIVSGDIHTFSLPLINTPPPPGSSSSNNSLNPFATPTPSESYSLDYISESKASVTEPKAAIYEPKSRRNSSLTKPESSILREVNSGFAVLKPGTLESEALAKETAQSQHTRSRSASFDGEKRQSRKLQKKRRPSESSRESSFDASSDLENGVKYSFDQHHQPSDRDVEKGLELESSAKYKF